MDINNIRAFFVLPETCETASETSKEMQEAFEVSFCSKYAFKLYNKLLVLQAKCHKCAMDKRK